jgi:O-antigen/teichoic acid export membrane protein
MEKSLFNNKPRTANSFKSSFFLVFDQIIGSLSSFAFRTIFLIFLSSEFLGLSSFFTSVLGILSLLDLGLGSCVSHALYKPIRDNDSKSVAKIMNFLKYSYNLVSLSIFIIGLCLMPFFPFLIPNNTIPSGINIYLVYFLFLLNTSSCYLFSYREVLLIADQEKYWYSLFDIALSLLNFGSQILILVISKNYLFAIIDSTVITILINLVFYLIIGGKYKSVFQEKKNLSVEEKRVILRDVFHIFWYRASSVINSNVIFILVSAFSGLFSLGIFSNYFFIYQVVFGFVTTFFGGFTSSLGNLHAASDKEKEKNVFDKLLILNFSICMFAASCFYLLINVFVRAWAGSEYVISDPFVVILLSTILFFACSQSLENEFIIASGLFNYRPWVAFIISCFYFILSIFLGLLFGVVGLLISMLISQIIFSIWFPSLVFRFVFRKGWGKWFLYLFISALFSVISSFLLLKLISIFPSQKIFALFDFVIVIFAISFACLTFLLIFNDGRSLLKDLRSFAVVRIFHSHKKTLDR